MKNNKNPILKKLSIIKAQNGHLFVVYDNPQRKIPARTLPRLGIEFTDLPCKHSHCHIDQGTLSTNRLTYQNTSGFLQMLQWKRN